MNPGAHNPAVPLENVVVTQELLQRPSRAPDIAAENRAMLELAQYLSENPTEILQKLAEVTLTLCRAGSAGISIIEAESEVFRWYAVAGALAAHRWGTLPRFFSPCGIVVDSEAVQLMSFPAKHFAYLAEVKPPVVEVLLIPFSLNKKIVGTVWVVSHDAARHFDNEDVRIVTNLTAFAAAGVKTQRTQNKLEAAIRNRDDFLAILGHELRNPLSPIATAYSLLCMSSLDEEIQKPAVEVIGRQLAHMQRLVNDILDASRIAEGKIAVTKQPVDIGGLVDEAIQSFSVSAAEAGLHLRAALPNQPVYVNADRDRIIQVVNNLLNNAIKFTPADGEVAVDVRVDGGQVRISVRDTGIGLAPENMHLIFSMFAQVDELSKSNKGGLGIGLGLAKTLTELHDGKIAVQSAGLNQGCEFSITLPVLADFKPELKSEFITTAANPKETAAPIYAGAERRVCAKPFFGAERRRTSFESVR